MKNQISPKQQSLTNFKKAKSHIEKIIQMIEDGNYCVDIMNQNLAVIGLLKSAHQMLMEGHLNSCFSSAIDSKSNKRKQEMIDEINKLMRISNK